MRISTTQVYTNLLAGITKQQDIQNTGNAQIASGTRFQTPAQAGLDYKISLDIRHAQTSIKGSLEAISFVESRLNASQTMLNDMSQAMTRVQTIAIQQAGATLTAAERASAAVEVGHLINRFIGDANQRWQGQSLFGGTATDRDAFVQDATGAVTYNGNDQNRTVAITANQQVVSNIRGDSPAFIDAFNAMTTFKTALETNDAAAMQNSIGTLNAAGNSIIDVASDVGARLNAMGFYRTSFEDMQIQLDKQLNTHEAVDIPTVVAEMQQSSIALQAAYSQIAKLQSLSLTSYLR